MNWSIDRAGPRVAEYGMDTAVSGVNNTLGATCATSNTKGAWVEIVASAPFDVGALLMTINFGGAVYDYLLDIGIGAAGSEQVLFPDLLLSGRVVPTGGLPQKTLTLPLRIPAGSRIAIRQQSSTNTSSNVMIAVHLLPASWFGESARVVTAYGVNAADSGATSVDPGATANTKGAWSQISAATVRDHRGLLMAVGNQVNTVQTAAFFMYDIGVGAAGSEQVLVPNLHHYFAANETIAPAYNYLPVRVPVGSRLAVRAQCSITDAVDRLSDVALYGFS